MAFFFTLSRSNVIIFFTKLSSIFKCAYQFLLIMFSMLNIIVKFQFKNIFYTRR